MFEIFPRMFFSITFSELTSLLILVFYTSNPVYLPGFYYLLVFVQSRLQDGYHKDYMCITFKRKVSIFFMVKLNNNLISPQSESAQKRSKWMRKALISETHSIQSIIFKCLRGMIRILFCGFLVLWQIWAINQIST